MLNLYGTNNYSYIYLEGLYKHLKSHGYTPYDADPCIYFKDRPSGPTLIASTVDDFLFTAPTHADIYHFYNTLKLKYRVTDLGPRLHSSVGSSPYMHKSLCTSHSQQ